MSRGLATNLLLQSENFAAWSSSGTVVITPYAGPFPAGVSAMQVLADDGSNSGHYLVSGAVSDHVGEEILISVHMKSVVGAGCILVQQIGGANPYAYVEVAGFTYSAVSNLGNPTFQDLGGGMFRVTMRWKNTGAQIVISLCPFLGGASYQFPHQENVVGGVMVEVAAPGQTTPSPYVASGATAGTGPRDYRQNWAPYSDDLTKWVPQTGGTATIVAGSVSGATADLLLRLLAPTGAGATPGMPFIFELDIMADAACTVPVLLADATDGTPTVQSNLPVTTTWTRWTVSMVTVSPNGGAIGIYVGDGFSFPTGRVVSIRRVSLSQNNGPGDFVATNGVSHNPSGAARLHAP